MIIRTLLTAAIACSGLLLASSENSSILQGSTVAAADEAATADTADQADTTQQQTTDEQQTSGEQQEDVSAADVKDAMEPFNALVGDWRGTGQVRRGSTRGAWREKTSVAWSFEKQPAILVKAYV